MVLNLFNLHLVFVSPFITIQTEMLLGATFVRHEDCKLLLELLMCKDALSYWSHDIITSIFTHRFEKDQEKCLKLHEIEISKTWARALERGTLGNNRKS